MPKPVPSAKTLPAWFVPTLLAAAGLFLIGLFSTEISDPDFWWHLKTGQYIVTQHRLPVPDPFSFTTATAAPGYPGEETTRRFNLTHEWLAQALWYLVYRVSGFGGVVLWKALLLAALCGLSGYVVWKRKGSALWAVGAAVGAASLAVEFAKDRPGILSYVFVAAFLAIFESRRRLWLLPVLSLIWANAHGGFFLGWVVCGAYCADALIRRAPDWRPVLLNSGIAVAVSLLNPNGPAALATVLRYRRSPMQSTLIEWKGAFDKGVASPAAFWILLVLAVLALLVSWKRVRISDWLLFAAFGAAAITAFRNELLVGLLAPILIVSYFPWKTASLPRIVPIAALLVLGVAAAWSRPMFEFRAAEWRFPAGAADILIHNHVNVPVFNTYEYGGYLIWKGLPVFIDGRALSESVFRDYSVMLGTASDDPTRIEMLDRYHVGAVVMNAFEYNTGAMYPMVAGMAMGVAGHWQLVYQDSQALVFLRDPPPGAPNLDKSYILDHMEAECRLHIAHEPELPLCARTLADYFLKAAEVTPLKKDDYRKRARQALRLYLDSPHDPADTDPSRKYLELSGQ